MGRQAEAYQLDTSNIKSFDVFVKEMTGHLKKYTDSPNIDFLINNAGTALYSPFASTTEEQFDAAMNIHFKEFSFSRRKYFRSSTKVDASSTSRRDSHALQFLVHRLTVR